MKHHYLFRLVSLILATFISEAYCDFELHSEAASVAFTQSSDSPPVLTTFRDFAQGKEHSTLQALALYCGEQPSGGSWKADQKTPTLLIAEGSLSCYDGMQAKIQYRLSGRELMVKAVFRASRSLEIPQGLAWRLSNRVSSIVTSNHLGKPPSSPLRVSNESHPCFGHCSNEEDASLQDPEFRYQKTITTYNHFNHFNLLRSSGKPALGLFIPNPFHAFLRLDSSDRQEAWLDILPTQPASSPYSSEDSWSQLDAGDSIVRQFSLTLDKFPERNIFLSEHPNGWDRSLTLYLDELPNRDNWEPITTATNPKTPVYSALVDVLLSFPRLKIGLLLLTDRELTRDYTWFPGWSTLHKQIIADTLDENEGSACAHFMGTQNSDTLTLTQELPGVYSDTILLAIDHKSHQQESQLNICLVFSNTEECRPLANTSQWHRDTLRFTKVPSNKPYTPRLRITSVGKVWTWIDNVILSDESGFSLNMENGGFESYVPDFLYADPRRHWSDAHGTEYLPNAPNSYLNFLQSLAIGHNQNGWEDRVRIGLHGLKHTSAIDLPEPEHEFSHYDPEGDSLRLSQLDMQLSLIGLDSLPYRFFRPSGLRSTRSLVHPLIDRGTVWFDPGWWYNVYPNRTFFLQRHGRTMWGRTLDWWLDRSDSDRSDSDWLLSTNDLFKNMQRGHFIHLGAHPESMLGAKESASALKSVLTEIEKRFPNAGYLFPDEFAQHATQTAQLNLTQGELADYFTLQIQGTIHAGTTIVFQGYSLDTVKSLFQKMSSEIAYRTDGQTVYAWFLTESKPFMGKQRLNHTISSYDIQGRSQKSNPQNAVQITKDGTENKVTFGRKKR